MSSIVTLLKCVCSGSLVFLSITARTQPPTVATNTATVVMWHTATLNGTMTGNGTLVSASFDYGTTTAYTNNVGGNPGQTSSSSPVSFNVSIGALSQNTTYHYRAKIFDGTGFTYGADKTFITKVPIPPTVSNIGVNYVAGNDFCVFTADVNANSFSTNAYVQYCLATDNFNTPSVQMLPSIINGTTAAPASYTAHGLDINKNYKYRVIATNAWGSDTSAEHSFSTSSSSSVANSLAAVGIVVYPNPVAALLMVDATNYSGDITISIDDAGGRTMKADVNRTNRKYVVRTSQLSAGNYWLRVADGKRSYSTPFVKR